MPNVKLHKLKTHSDDRGELTEIFRQEWFSDNYCQVNYVYSAKNVLRGVHVHHRHSDFIVTLSGEMQIAIKDLREGSSTFMQTDLFILKTPQSGVLEIPPGVLHGFYFPVESSFVYSVSNYWDKDDELGCIWNDPKLELSWKVEDPKLSMRDKNAGWLDDLMITLKTYQKSFCEF